jgi:hypothetical protein
MMTHQSSACALEVFSVPVVSSDLALARHAPSTSGLRRIDPLRFSISLGLMVLGK